MSGDPWYNPEKTYDENYVRGPGQSLIRAGSARVGGLPFGIPAGPLLNASFVVPALEAGFDWPVYKTVRSRAYESHPWPNVVAVSAGRVLKNGAVLTTQPTFLAPLSITNSFGVPSKDPDVWQPDVAVCVAAAKPGQCVVGSCQGTRWPGYSDLDYIHDWADTARLMCETQVSYIEINLSCPNEGTKHLVCFDTELATRIVYAVKDAIGDTPLTIKISYFESGPRELLKAVGAAVQGVSAINTIPARVVDPGGLQALPGPGRESSGICGASIKWAGLEMVRGLVRLREEFDHTYLITGVGGVMVPEDYAEYRAAGADIVMSATGAMWRPSIAEEIRATLV